MAAKKAASKKAKDEKASVAVATGGTEQVVVTGRRLATATTKAPTPLVVDPDSPLTDENEYSPVAVKATRSGVYGHKMRAVGEVFLMYVHDKIKELPSWVIHLEDAEPGQDEGSRGIRSGGREDDELRLKREARRKKEDKALRKSLGKGAENVVDPTIVNNTIPLTEGGNAAQPQVGGGDGVI